MKSVLLQRCIQISLLLSSALFGVYFANVLIGGLLKHTPWFDDVTEMLLLMSAVLLFVIGILCLEKAAEKNL